MIKELIKEHGDLLIVLFILIIVSIALAEIVKISSNHKLEMAKIEKCEVVENE